MAVTRDEGGGVTLAALPRPVRAKTHPCHPFLHSTSRVCSSAGPRASASRWSTLWRASASSTPRTWRTQRAPRRMLSRTRGGQQEWGLGQDEALGQRGWGCPVLVGCLHPSTSRWAHLSWGQSQLIKEKDLALLGTPHVSMGTGCPVVLGLIPLSSPKQLCYCRSYKNCPVLPPQPGVRMGCIQSPCTDLARSLPGF